MVYFLPRDFTYYIPVNSLDSQLFWVTYIFTMLFLEMVIYCKILYVEH